MAASARTSRSCAPMDPANGSAGGTRGSPGVTGRVWGLGVSPSVPRGRARSRLRASSPLVKGRLWAWAARVTGRPLRRKGCGMDARPQDRFERFRSLFFHDARLGLGVDVSRIRFAPGFLEGMAPRVDAALAAMAALEAGAVANPDEKRMVGH